MLPATLLLSIEAVTRDTLGVHARLQHKMGDLSLKSLVETGKGAPWLQDAKIYDVN